MTQSRIPFVHDRDWGKAMIGTAASTYVRLARISGIQPEDAAAISWSATSLYPRPGRERSAFQQIAAARFQVELRWRVLLPRRRES